MADEDTTSKALILKRAKNAEWMRRWRSTHAEESRARVLRCVQKRPELAKARSERWYKRNAARLSKEHQAWRKEHPAEAVALRKTQYAKYRETILKCNRESRERLHPDVRRDRYFKSKYGIAVGTYAEMLKEQDGLCAACKATPSEGRRLRVDHHHESGKVRGLLCDSCNRTLGHAKESPERLRACAEYVEKHLP